MKVMYLGTAASEGYPAMFCDCDNCIKARELGGKNLRCRSQTLINHDLLIDWNSDTLSNTYKYGLDFSKLNYLLITHTHEDHFQPWEFSLLAKPFAIKRGSGEKFNIYGSADIEAPIAENTQNFAERYAVKVNVIKPFESQKIGDYTVTALKANHGSDNPYNYIIEQGGKAMLYAHDTGFLLPETYEYIKNSGVRFDFVSLDCTSGNSPMGYNSHMNIERGTLREGITWQDVVDRFPQNDYLCNNQVFDLMVEKGIYKFEEYNEFVTKNFHWYVDTQKVKEIVNIQYPSVSEVIDAVKKAGGVPGVAHPKGQSKYANELMEMGIMGFETLHPHLGEADSKFFDEFCEANRLYKFGGTDHSSVLSGYLGRMPQADYPPESGGMTEKSFMQLYKRELG